MGAWAGAPAEVAVDIAARFGGLAERVGFTTPSLVADDMLGELVDELHHATLTRHPIRAQPTPGQ